MQETYFILAFPLPSLAFFRSALALVMIVAGTLHFVATDAYVSIMPDYLPLHRELVYLSGILFSKTSFQRSAILDKASFLSAIFLANLALGPGTPNVLLLTMISISSLRTRLL